MLSCASLPRTVTVPGVNGSAYVPHSGLRCHFACWHIMMAAGVTISRDLAVSFSARIATRRNCFKWLMRRST